MHGVVALQGGFLPNFGIGPGTQTFGQGGAQLHFILHRAVRQGLGIGVADDEVYAPNALQLHVVNGVGTAATYTYHLDDRRPVFG